MWTPSAPPAAASARATSSPCRRRPSISRRTSPITGRRRSNRSPVIYSNESMPVLVCWHAYARILTVLGLAATFTVIVHGGPAHADEPRQSHTTVVGVHNTYQKATFPYLADALDSGTGLIELDVWADSWTRRWRVNHEIVGQDNNCTAGGLRTGTRNQDLAGCLANIRAWHDAHPDHRPLIVKVELKAGFDSRVGLGPADFDRLVAAQLGNAVYRPADLLARYPTLDAAALADNWPTRSALAGKILIELIPGTF